MVSTKDGRRWNRTAIWKLEHVGGVVLSEDGKRRWNAHNAIHTYYHNATKHTDADYLAYRLSNTPLLHPRCSAS